MTLTPVQQAAYDDISSHLEDGWFSGVNEDDLNAIRDTLGDLGATDADAVIDAMADAGKLQKFADELNQGEFAGIGQDGLSNDERKALFADLAGKLDGDSLANFSNAIAEAESKHTDFQYVTELGDAVATHASPQVKLDYIEGLSDKVDGEGITDVNLGGGSSTRNVDSEAGAIGTVLGSMNGSWAEQAFGSLSSEQLDAVLATGIDETVRVSGSSVTSSFDTARYEDVLRAAGTMNDADLKARIFDAAAKPLRTVRDADDFPAISLNDEDLQGMSAALTSLIESDTTGIVRELTYNTETQDGSALATYSQVMIETGQTEKLANHMTKLQFGNDLSENAIERLDEVTVRGGQEFRENAAALGYFTGAVYAGAEAHSGDVKKQQEVITGFLDFVLGKIPGAGGIKPTDAFLGQDMVKAAVEAAINDPGAAPAQRLERAALPQNPGTGELAVGDPITNSFDTTINRVIRAAQP